MKLLIICDHIMLKELSQNGIINMFRLEQHCNIDCISSVPETISPSYHCVIVWSHTTDKNNYDSIRQKLNDTQKLISCMFPQKISYWKKDIEVTDAWGKPMYRTIREHPHYHTPSKYLRGLQLQLGEIVSAIKQED